MNQTNWTSVEYGSSNLWSNGGIDNTTLEFDATLSTSTKVEYVCVFCDPIQYSVFSKWFNGLHLICEDHLATLDGYLGEVRKERETQIFRDILDALE